MAIPSQQRLRRHYQSLWDAACRQCAPNADGSYLQDAVESALARIVRANLDLDHAAMLKAKKIVDMLTKQAGEDDDDDNDDDGLTQQLELFGEVYAYNPRRLIKDTLGNIIEEDKATLPFILAEVARSADHLSRVAKWNNRKARKALFFQQWCEHEMEQGRDRGDLTWGACARETGILSRSKAA